MSRRLGLTLQVLVLAVSIGYSLFMARSLPAIVPTHWGISGKPDAYGSAATDLWLMPGCEAFIILLTFALPALSPRRYEVTRFPRTYSYLMVLVTGLMGALHFVIVNAAGGTHIDMNRTMMSVLFAFFALLGNVMGKVKQNFYIGVRTPWTLADGRVWNATHREAGHIWLFAGILGVFASLANAPFAVVMAGLLIMAFVPVVRSFFLYRRIAQTDGPFASSEESP